MATPFRILLILVALVLAAILAVAGFLLTLDPEAYREDIVRGVRDSTGLDLRLDGPIDLELWPTISLSVQDAAADWEDASVEPLASMRRLEFALPLMPLLTGREARIGNVLIEGVSLDLRVDAEGRGNWLPPADASDGETAAETADADAEAGDTPPTTVADGTGETEIGLDLRLERVELLDLDIRYRDATDDTDVALSGLEVVLESTGSDSFDARLGGRLDVQDGPRVAFGGTLSGDKELRSLLLEEISADVELPDWARPLPIRIAGRIDRDDADLRLNELRVDVGELSMIVDGSITEDGTRRALDIDAVLADSDLRALLERSGAAPQTRDPNALRRLAGRIGLRGFTDEVRVDPLAIEIDALDIAGTATIRTTPVLDVRFALDAGRLDLLPYLAEAPPEDAATATAPLVDDAPLGLDALADLVVDGSLGASAIVLPGLEIGESSITIAARDGRIDVAMDLASVLGGDVDADTRIDVTAATPRLALTLDVDGIDGARLAPDAGFAGAVSLAGRIEATGESSAALARTASGRLDLSGTPGVLDVRRLRAGLLPLAQLLGRGEKIASWPDELRYERLVGTWTLSGSRDQVVDLALDNMRLDARGGIALDTGVFDFRTGALFATETPRTFDVPRDLDGIRLPARCAGRLGEPGNPCGFDQQATGDLVAQIAASKAGDAIRENISERIPEQLRAPADAILRGLFGRPRQESDPATPR